MNSDDDDDKELFTNHIHEDCDCYFDEDEDEDLIMNIPIPKQQKQVDFVPSSMLMARTIQEQPSQRLLKVLFDGGGTRTLCNSRCLPKGVTPYLLETPVEGLTIAGRFKANRAVRFQDVVLPEFS
jgi:hypothetical protein